MPGSCWCSMYAQRQYKHSGCTELPAAKALKYFAWCRMQGVMRHVDGHGRKEGCQSQIAVRCALGGREIAAPKQGAGFEGWMAGCHLGVLSLP